MTKTIWIVDESSRHYEWFAAGETEQEAVNAFKKMWNSWCKETGADPYYWGSVGDKWDGIYARPIKLGQGYMDREPFRV